MFLVGDPNLNLHLPLASWEGLSNPSDIPNSESIGDRIDWAVGPHPPGQLDLIHLGSWTSSTFNLLPDTEPEGTYPKPSWNPKSFGWEFPRTLSQNLSREDPRLQNQREPNSTKPLTPASSQSLIACNPNSNLLGKKIKISPSTATNSTSHK